MRGEPKEKFIEKKLALKLIWIIIRIPIGIPNGMDY
jgi:hypothetical protein